MSKIPARWWIGALALTFVANFLVANFYLPFVATPAVGIQFRFDSDDARVWKVEAGSPALAAELRSGDLIKAVSGQPIHSANEYYLREQLISARAPFILTVDRAGVLQDVTVPLSGSYFSSLGSLNRFALIFWSFVAALELILALGLALSRPSDRTALLAAVFIAVLTTLNGQSAGLITAFRALPIVVKALISPVLLISIGIPFFAFLFFANFPRPLFRSRGKWIAVCLPAFVIYCFTAILNFPLLFGSHPELLFQSWTGRLFLDLQLPLVVIIAAYSIAAVAAIIVNFRRCDLAERRRIKLMLVGALIGLCSVAPAAIIHDLTNSDLISRSGVISVAFGLLRIIFLFVFVYAVLKHRVFEIPVLLQRSGRYLIVQRGFLILLALAGVGSTFLFARFLPRVLPAAAPYSAPIGVLFGIALVWLGTLVHQRVQHRLDRAFFRSAYDAQQVLEEMADRSRRATSRFELMELLRQHVERALHPSTLVILLEGPNGRLESAQSSQPTEWGVLSLDSSTPRFKALGHSGKTVELDETDWEKAEFKDLAPLRPECLVPIIGRTDRLLGLLVLGSKLSEEPYSSSDLRLLQSAARQAGLALENISLAEDIAERLQTEQIAAHELAIARAVQSKLLPSSAPALASLQCEARCIQAKQVGGDFYDFIEYGQGRLGLVLADIAGKGISAALLMANLQAQLRSQRLSSPKDIAAALETVNRQFRKSIEVGGFATLFFGLYDDATGVLTYANCGHAPAVVMRQDGRVHRLESTATVIGAFADWHCDLEEITFGKDDVFILYSDGITEAEDQEGDLFGEARLLELLHGCKDLSADQLLEVIIGGALDFSRNQQIDDITLVVAKALAVPASQEAGDAGQFKAKA
jgi:sigma-B regulation protein RsbU (phosphoserine phosphatase)